MSVGGGLAWALASCASGGSLQRIENARVLPPEAGEHGHRFEIQEESDRASEAVGAAITGQEVRKVVPSETTDPAPLTSRRVPKAGPRGFPYPNRRPTIEPYQAGERADYDINYLGVNAGRFSLRILPYKQINGRKVYHVHGEARSSKVFSLFYSLNDTIETFIDFEALAPHRFQVILDESKQKRNSLELYDSEKGETFFWNRLNHHKRGYVEVKDTFPMRPFSQDSLSALFFIRAQSIREDEPLQFPVVSEGKNWDAVVTLVKREDLNTPLGRVKTMKLKLETQYQGVLKKQGDSHIWVTDDHRRVLVRLEAKVRIGSIVAELKNFEPGRAEASGAMIPVLSPPRGGSGVDEVVPSRLKVRSSR